MIRVDTNLHNGLKIELTLVGDTLRLDGNLGQDPPYATARMTIDQARDALSALHTVIESAASGIHAVEQTGGGT